MGGLLLQPTLRWLAQAVIDALNLLWDLLATTVFLSPDVTTLPQVVTFSRTSMGIVNGCYVLAFLWAAILILGRGTIQSTIGPGELIPRLLVGLIAANFATPICSGIIQTANALTLALTGKPIAGAATVQQLRSLAGIALRPSEVLTPGGALLVLIGVVVAVLVVRLILQWIVRIGLLIVVAGVAPIALALHGTPQTEVVAKLWWRTFFGALATVLLQAVSLHLALSILLDPASNLPMIGMPGEPTAILNALIALSLVWGVGRIPAMLRRLVTQPRPSALGTIARIAILQQLTRGAQRLLVPRITARASRQTRGRRRGSGGGQGSGGGRRHGAGRPRTARRPAGARPGVVGIAYPTGRPVRPYTREDIAGGVDVYTRALRARRRGGTTGGTPT